MLRVCVCVCVCVLFIKTHSVESRRVIGPENSVFRRVRESLSARKLYRPGQ